MRGLFVLLLTACAFDHSAVPGDTPDGAGPDGACTTDPETCACATVTCTNPHGTTSCQGGVCMPVCLPGSRPGQPLSQDCNGNVNDGCELLRDNNPECATAMMDTTEGDRKSPDNPTFTGSNEGWFIIQITEGEVNPEPLEALITLTPDANVDFDLEVSCGSCVSSGIGPVTAPQGLGTAEQISVTKADVDGETDMYTVTIHIVYVGATGCGSWMLVVDGDPDTTATTLAQCL